MIIDNSLKLFEWSCHNSLHELFYDLYAAETEEEKLKIADSFDRCLQMQSFIYILTAEGFSDLDWEALMICGRLSDYSCKEFAPEITRFYINNGWENSIPQDLVNYNRNVKV